MFESCSSSISPQPYYSLSSSTIVSEKVFMIPQGLAST
nr:MAG TPA: hypothetical protein [Caudoviricetes sp.]